ncbi:uncharacterized protein LOC115628608 [Scaptodrosophila lebanonensis]|uniref:Uncharacterized protein LOC115628608 n=1 Tax=Drosophila lebanonensis TaxID=7225 RepID=A0A6J2U0L9_DROLE|nr:uncharacterized protein LOC115628608 [Scaptodrosophila lebanonensis]
MDKPQILMLRTPLNAQNQIFIFDSPIDYMDKQLIVYQRPGVLPGDDGYCVVFKRDHFIINSAPNYQSPTKRSFLNECIRQLYLINGWVNQLHWDGQSLNNRKELWRQVDICLRSGQRPVNRRESVHRVKRQLFRDDRGKRKWKKPKRSSASHTQIINFRSIRDKIGRQHVRRSYLKPARTTVIQRLICENLQREMRTAPAAAAAISAAHEFINANADILCSYKQELARSQPMLECNNQTCCPRRRPKHLDTLFMHQQMQHAVQNHQLILEESVRSMYYAKELFRLMEDHDKFLHPEKQILGQT